ncbi:MAG: low-specificity L-threonine aldolase [Candidatus Hydrogenedentes bacterium]|nr:low-specificity L-threonine aldolase [Candidatus Hydrogenedentota bacterium]
MIDLRSDTVTKPSPGMREAMAAAEVGDDVFQEDPTVNALQDHAAKLLGKEAALFVPSGTMANLCAFLAQTRPGETIILSEGAHPYHYEAANVAVVGGLLTCPIPDALCKLTPDQIADKIVQIDDPHFSHTTIVAIENTTNRGGGACYTTEEVAAIGGLCRERGLRLHCDGARLFNAAVATGGSAEEYARSCDSICFCLSKGLGAPVGSLLLGTRETIYRAHRFRKLLGGGMRQAGVLAAAGLYALEHHIDDLREDHWRARQFREAMEAEGLQFPLPSPTNILYIDLEDAYGWVGALADEGVLVLPMEATRIRVVFHRDITDDDLARAIAVFRKRARKG